MATLSQPAIAMLSRARESAPDRAALRVTGSPASLASALQTVDETIAHRPPPISVRPQHFQRSQFCRPIPLIHQLTKSTAERIKKLDQ
ncbi:hypothetical protein [Halocatena halophila]|uniref:hypothetical protein n=1 Tax=Halocatena halophila TaxID=2814576 RepID=UPI002ED491B7